MCMCGLAVYVVYIFSLVLSSDLKEIGINTRSWIDSAQDTDYWRALVNVTLNPRIT